MILVDSNVILDLVTNDSVWADWSVEQLETASQDGTLVINDAIYAEVSVRYKRIEDLDLMFEEAGILHVATPKAALFLAGKAFQTYRRAGGTRNAVLPDFFIGAHAAVAGAPLITRDAARYRSYFPTVTLIAPEGGSRA